MDKAAWQALWAWSSWAKGAPKRAMTPSPGELVDGSFVAVDFLQEDLEAAVHDLVDHFGVELLGEGSVGGHIGEEDRHDLALPFQGGPGGEDLIG